MMNDFGDVCSSSESVMMVVKAEEEDDNAGVSSEDSSCPEDSILETELDLALGLSIGRNHLASSSSSLTRESGTKRSSVAASKRQVAIGWPPLRSYRINSLVNQAKSLATDSTKNGAKSPMLVKVTMDGVIIGRKVDLNALESYEVLKKTLEQMFFQIPSSDINYIIAYQDKDGDWMLVGDVPWQMFLGSVKRLRIMRTSSETGVCK